MHLYGQKKKAAKKDVDKARNDMEADLYTKLDEDAGKKMIYKMARHRNVISDDTMVLLGQHSRVSQHVLSTQHEQAFCPQSRSDHWTNERHTAASVQITLAGSLPSGVSRGVFWLPGNPPPPRP